MPHVTEVSHLPSPPSREDPATDLNIKVVSTAKSRLHSIHEHPGISTQDTMHDSKMTKGHESLTDDSLSKGVYTVPGTALLDKDEATFDSVDSHSNRRRNVMSITMQNFKEQQQLGYADSFFSVKSSVQESPTKFQKPEMVQITTHRPLWSP